MTSASTIKEPGEFKTFDIAKDPYEITTSFNGEGRKSPFCSAGAMSDFKVCTCEIEEDYHGPRETLGDVIVPSSNVPEEFFVSEDKLGKWKYLKGGKSEKRINKTTGFEYRYSEGSMAFPDLLSNPSRTILTGEGGSGASRFKHIIEVDGRFRRLVPEELEQLQGFPKGWTDTDMTDGHRAFCMGNALVVGVVHRIGKEIARRAAKKDSD